ncbi:MAG: hypothetical protein KJ935_06635, partial [Candidatus Omnitrophica bacterium]|nr:hypothetical protein [Candidatus Omnitrophota bacterium]
FCTPGMITMGKSLFDCTPRPEEREIKEHLKGNTCRCTGYINIIKAISNAAEKIAE